MAGLYVGCVASMLEIAPYTAIAFTSYEGLKQRLLVGQAGTPVWCRRVFAGHLAVGKVVWAFALLGEFRKIHSAARSEVNMIYTHKGES